MLVNWSWGCKFNNFGRKLECSDLKHTASAGELRRRLDGGDEKVNSSFSFNRVA